MDVSKKDNGDNPILVSPPHKIENTADVTCVEWRRAVLLWKKGFVKDVDTCIKFNS